MIAFLTWRVLRLRLFDQVPDRQQAGVGRVGSQSRHPYKEIASPSTTSVPRIDECVSSKASTICFRHPTFVSTMSSGRITANGSSPTSSLAISTAWPRPSASGCRTQAKRPTCPPPRHPNPNPDNHPPDPQHLSKRPGTSNSFVDEHHSTRSIRLKQAASGKFSPRLRARPSR